MLISGKMNFASMIINNKNGNDVRSLNKLCEQTVCTRIKTNKKQIWWFVKISGNFRWKWKRQFVHGCQMVGTMPVVSLAMNKPPNNSYSPSCRVVCRKRKRITASLIIISIVVNQISQCQHSGQLSTEIMAKQTRMIVLSSVCFSYFWLHCAAISRSGKVKHIAAPRIFSRSIFNFGRVYIPP